MKRVAEVTNLYADTIKKIAQAEAEENGPQLQLYMKQLEVIQGMVNGQGNAQRMEAQQNNAGGIQGPAAMAGGIAPANAGPALPGLPAVGAGA